MLSHLCARCESSRFSGSADVEVDELMGLSKFANFPLNFYEKMIRFATFSFLLHVFEYNIIP